MSKIQEVFKWLTTAGIKPVTSEEEATQRVQLWKDLMNEEIKETLDAFHKQDEKEFINGIADLFFVLHNLPVFFGVENKYLKELDKVVKSNYTKFCKTETEAIASVNAYAAGVHPNKIGEKIDAYYTKVGEYFVIKREKDHKILKSIEFKDTNQL